MRGAVRYRFKADEAALDGKQYKYILNKPYRWESWAAPKTADGKLDHNTAMVGDDLRDFVNQKLFPYLHGFKERASGPNTIELPHSHGRDGVSLPAAEALGYFHSVRFADVGK